MFNPLERGHRGYVLFFGIIFGLIFFARYAEVKFERGLTTADKIHILTMHDSLAHLKGGELLVMRDGAIQKVMYPVTHSEVVVETHLGDKINYPLMEGFDYFPYRVEKIVTVADSSYARYAKQFVLKQ